MLFCFDWWKFLLLSHDRLKQRHDDGEMVETLSRYDEDELTVAVIQGLSSLGSTTAMAAVATAGLVCCIDVYTNIRSVFQL